MKKKSALDTVQSLAQKTLKRSSGKPLYSSPVPVNKESKTPNAPPPFVDINSKDLRYDAVEVPGQAPVPQLANKLDRVLFSPGVHFLKDHRTNVYNFDSRLEQIMSITDFDFRLIPPYVPAGRDSKLSVLAQEHQKKYTGSTSSLTPVLTQLHHALSHHRPPQILNLPKYFPGNITSFSAVQRAPTNMWLVNHPNTNTWAVSMAGGSQELILTLLGQAMETMLTTDCDEFAKWSKHHPENAHNVGKHADEKATASSSSSSSSTYNYTSCGPFLMRSQLDCHDPRLPGTGMFDLKTRASCAIRHDIDYAQIRDGSDYQILKNDGHYESFAREFYELVRSAMFKYSLQARIGRMDGIFVAYHSVRRLFGFEYLPLAEIDKIYHTAQLVPQTVMKPSAIKHDAVDLDTRLASVASTIADKEFVLSVELLGKIFDTLLAKVQRAADRDLNMVVHCNAPGQLLLFVRPATFGDVDEIALTGPSATKDTPPDLHGFRIKFTQSINDKFVPTNRYPSLHSGTDEWRVSAVMEPLSPADLEARFKETQAQYVYQDLTSEPRTADLPDAEELQEMLAKLPQATEMQMLLRKLDKQGTVYAEWDQKRPKIEL